MYKMVYLTGKVLIIMPINNKDTVSEVKEIAQGSKDNRFSNIKSG